MSEERPSATAAALRSLIKQNESIQAEIRELRDCAFQLRACASEWLAEHPDSPNAPAIREVLIKTNWVASNFACHVCGKTCDVAPDPPARAVCPEHCEDHEYAYERGEQRHLCKHCGQERPIDWGE